MTGHAEQTGCALVVSDAFWVTHIKTEPQHTGLGPGTVRVVLTLTQQRFTDAPPADNPGDPKVAVCVTFTRRPWDTLTGDAFEGVIPTIGGLGAAYGSTTGSTLTDQARLALDICSATESNA